eukprot:jgi/Hompol1/5074/HPOL_001296-RA
MEGFSHRSSLKQSNKPFKSKHATKGSIKAKNKGKSEAAKSVKHRNLAVSLKADRRNAAKIEQRKKRLDSQSNARLFQGLNATPKIVAIVPLCPDVDANAAAQSLFSSLDQPYAIQNGKALLIVERFKQRIQLIPCGRNLLQMLDALKVADMVVFLTSANEEVDKFGEACMTAIKSQGVPTVINMVQHLEEHAIKKQGDIRKSLLYYMEHHFPGEQRLFSSQDSGDCISAIRFITSQRPKHIVWRDRHAFLVADNISFVPNENDQPDQGTLLVTGFVRGSKLSANRLVHIPNYGDFQISVITAASTKQHEKMSDNDDNLKVLDVPDPAYQETLVAENEPDPMDGEQTWPTEEELAEADERVRRLRSGRGTDADDTMDDGAGRSSAFGEEEYDDVELEDRDVAFDTLDEQEEKQQLEEFMRKQRESHDDMQFPDEVDTPQDIPARERFQRYRGLKSFRNSTWDPYENLPVDYACIFQFQNFRRSKKRVMDSLEEGGGVLPGTYVTLHLKNVPRQVFDGHSNERLFCVFGLLPYEHKISIVNFVVQRNQDYTEPVKSKDPMILMSGFRRYVIQPVYSTYTRGGANNVHKFERYLQHGSPSVATVYAPIQFGPAPVLMFKYDPTGEHSWTPDNPTPLVATGNLMDLDPLRIIAKRIILTGHPFKVHKRGAVVRFMFFNPEDVMYFKPVQLVTKLGRTGHIKESLGTHGYMKCQFDTGIKQHDTVCMHLYKRVFPKWNTRPFVEDYVNSEAGAIKNAVEGWFRGASNGEVQEDGMN